MKRLALAPLAFVLAACPAAASVTAFSSFSGWQAAAGPTTLEDFAAAPLGPLTPGTTDIGTFSIFIDKNGDNRNSIADDDPNFFIGYIDNPADSNTLGAFVIRLLFDAPLTAFAASWSSTTTGDRLRATIDGTTFRFEDFLTGTGSGFLGWVSTDPFDEIILSVGNASPTIDGESFGMGSVLLAPPVADVPEPAAAALLLAGVCGLWSLRRRRP